MSGWVKKLEQHLAVIRLNAYDSFEVGERLNGECSGDGAMARFEGAMVSQAGQEITVRFTATLSYGPSDTTIRIRAEGIEASLHDGINKIDLLVMDVSPQSLGGIITQPVGMGTKMDVTVMTDSGEIFAKVKVMNCRLTEEGCYRVGLMFAQISRLDEARWARLLDKMLMA